MTDRQLWHFGALWTLKVTDDQSGGAFCLAEQLLPKGFAPPVHRHTREDEAWIVLDGELDFFLGDDRIGASAGAYVFGPRDVAHSFLVTSEQARVATLIAPGLLERFFHETGEPAPRPVLPPPPDGPPDFDSLLAKMTEFGVEFVAPPPH